MNNYVSRQRTKRIDLKTTERKGMIMFRESDKLLELIKKAIADGVVTNKEYSQILAQAASDGQEDAEERALLSNLQELISSGSVKRVA